MTTGTVSKITKRPGSGRKGWLIVSSGWPERGSDAGAVDSVRRACQLMRALSEHDSLTVRGAALIVGGSPTSAHRLLSALHAGGFAHRDERGRYRSPGRDLSTVIDPIDRAEASPLTAVRRALLLLRLLSAGRVLSVKGASELLGVASSTAHRILKSLVLEGMAIQLPDRQYRSGPSLAGGRPLAMSDILDALEPAVEALSDDTGETIHVWMPQGPYVRLVHGLKGPARDAVPHDQWRRVPAYSTAGGRTLLASLPNPHVESLHRSGFPPWRHSPLADIRSLKRRLSVVRRRGFETNFEEGAQGVSGLAVCATDSLQRPVLAIGLALPSRRFDATAIQPFWEALEGARKSMEEELTCIDNTACSSSWNLAT